MAHDAKTSVGFIQPQDDNLYCIIRQNIIWGLNIIFTWDTEMGHTSSVMIPLDHVDPVSIALAMMLMPCNWTALTKPCRVEGMCDEPLWTSSQTLNFSVKTSSIGVIVLWKARVSISSMHTITSAKCASDPIWWTVMIQSWGPYMSSTGTIFIDVLTMRRSGRCG